MKTLRILVLVLMAALIGSFVWLAAQGDLQELLFEQLESSHWSKWALVAAISLLTILSILTGLPVLYFAMAIGFLLPLVPALLVAWAVNLAGVMAGFYMIRSLFTDYFRNRYGKKKLIRSIDKRVEKYGLWTVVLSRGIYIIPTNLINFSFPLSRIRAGAYLGGSMLGLVPEVLINVLTGYLIKHELLLISSADSQLWQILIIAVFILTLLLGFVVLRYLRKRSRRKNLIEEVIPYKN